MGTAARKGSDFEEEILETFIKPLFGETAVRPRLKGHRDFGDYGNVGNWLIEAKKWNKWDVPAWIRALREKIQRNGTGNNPWMIVFAADRRTMPGTFVLMPLDLAFQLLNEAKATDGHLPAHVEDE